MHGDRASEPEQHKSVAILAHGCNSLGYHTFLQHSGCTKKKEGRLLNANFVIISYVIYFEYSTLLHYDHEVYMKIFIYIYFYFIFCNDGKH
jgi:hypothetical protein